MSRGLRNNNPGNIRHDRDKWQGEIVPSQDKSFKQFISMAYGYRALIKLLQNYRKLHNRQTIAEFINRYAPPCETIHQDTLPVYAVKCRYRLLIFQTSMTKPQCVPLPRPSAK